MYITHSAVLEEKSQVTLTLTFACPAKKHKSVLFTCAIPFNGSDTYINITTII